MADHFVHIDLKDKEGLHAAARDWKERSGLDGVFTAGTDFSTSAAWVSEKLGLPGIPYESALCATDKCLMRAAFEKAGVPSPRFVCWEGQGNPRRLLRDLVYPLVVKPVDNMGARGVRRVDGSRELEEACDRALPLSRTSRVIIEEFMEGRELSMDAVVHEGRVAICGVADRHIRFPPRFVEMGHTMPTDLDAATVVAAESVFSAGIRALGINNGAAKGDIKVTPAGPKVGEIAARLSGGYMSGWTFPLSSGVEVTEAAMNIALGLPPGDLTPRMRRVSAERALISIPGIVEAVEGEEEARSVEGMVEVFLRTGAGQEVVFPANNVEKCGNVISAAEDREMAVGAARRALHSLSIRLKPCVERTDVFLFREKGIDAFTLRNQGLQMEIAALPPFRGDPWRLSAGFPLFAEAPDGIARETAEDWHGLGLADSLDAFTLKTGVPVLAKPPESAFTLSGLFWRALVRGSAQGARYLVDSVRRAAELGHLPEFLKRL
jgi:biotin carboxylase